MTLTARPLQLATLVAAMAILLNGLAGPAHAEPTTPPNEGGSSTLMTLRANLEASAIGWLEAQAALESSQKRQVELNRALTLAEVDLVRSKIGVAKYASEAYRTGRLGVLGVMLNTTSPDGFLNRAAALEKMTQRDQTRLGLLVSAKKRATDAKAGLDAEVKEQQKQVNELAKRKKQAERALSALGGYATKGWVDPLSPLATPARRNPDGSWPKEGCTINDPTTTGCITPRTLHAMKQAQVAGFKRYVSCYRPGDMYEHPKGRACDFSSSVSGFQDASAKADDKLYGDKLASFYVKNASRLGVLYVIWYCKVWLPSSGWRNYSSAGSRCGDSPASDHTNHVHLSVY